MQSRPLQGMRVLVVEDEYYMADDLVRALDDAGAVPVGPFCSIPTAETAIANDNIGAAVLDLNLHGERTDDLARRLDRQQVPCLIVSGYSEEALPADLRHLRRLEKPVETRKLLAVLGEQVTRSAA